jgi:hypothetical protein
LTWPSLVGKFCDKTHSWFDFHFDSKFYWSFSSVSLSLKHIERWNHALQLKLLLCWLMNPENENSDFEDPLKYVPVEFLEIFHWTIEQFHSILICCFLGENSFTDEIMNSFSSIEYFLLWFEVFISDWDNVWNKWDYQAWKSNLFVIEKANFAEWKSRLNGNEFKLSEKVIINKKR